MSISTWNLKRMSVVFKWQFVLSGVRLSGCLPTAENLRFMAYLAESFNCKHSLNMKLSSEFAFGPIVTVICVFPGQAHQACYQGAIGGQHMKEHQRWQCEFSRQLGSIGWVSCRCHLYSQEPAPTLVDEVHLSRMRASYAKKSQKCNCIMHNTIRGNLLP